MKFLKLFFSKIFLIGLMVILEVALITNILLFFSNFVWLYQIVRIIIIILMFAHLAHKRQGEEFKLPWLVTLFIAPIPVAIFYVTFATPHLTRKSKNSLAAILAETAKYAEYYAPKKKKIAKVLKGDMGIENYLVAQGSTYGHLNNKIDFYPLGEDFFPALIEDLKKAEKFIFMEYFIIEKGVFWNAIFEVLEQKLKEGVEVRIMYDDIGSATKLNIRFAIKLRKKGFNVRKFSPFIASVSNMFNNRDHRKITVIDGKVGYTGGINLADEYINRTHPHGHWKDTAIRIEGSAVKNLTTLFLGLFDLNLKKSEGLDYSKYLDIDYPAFDDGGYVHPFGTGPIPVYYEQVAQNNFLNMINAAKKSVYITTPYLILNHAFITALRTAAARGVDVRIVTPHIPDKKLVFAMTRSTYSELIPAGIKVYEYTPGFIHAKQMIVDGKLAFVGTINLDYRSLAHHYECGAIIYDAPCCKDIAIDFEKIFELSEEINDESFKLSKFSRFMLTILSIFRPIF